MKPKVLITNLVPESHLEPLLDCAEIIYGPDRGATMPREEVMDYAPELSAIINQHELIVDDELLDKSPNLRIISNVAMGANNIDFDAVNKRGIWITNCPYSFADATADHTLGLLLSVARRITESDTYMRGGTWPNDGFQPGIWDGMLLAGKTIGIVGFGNIGQAVAQRAAGFGMKVIFNTAHPKEDPRYCDLDTLLKRADVISLNLPLTTSNQHMINAPAFAKMKKGAILINMARGPIIDEAALVDALKNKTLLGAGLDVFEKEPQVHPQLLKMPNVVLTPHVGGGTRESRKAARLLCARNIAAVLRGERPDTPMNCIEKIG